MPVKDSVTEAKIIEAARIVFTRKGFSGARMEHIAAEAKINKASLHYYFRSKEKLFSAIFTESMQTIIPVLNDIFNADIDFFKKIELFTEKYIDLLTRHPYLPAFVINEINREPEVVKNFLTGMKHKPGPQKFIEQINREIKAGRIRKTDPMQIVVNIISLCVFPFVARPMLQNILKINDRAFKEFIQQRKKEVSMFIIQSLKK